MYPWYRGMSWHAFMGLTCSKAQKADVSLTDAYQAGTHRLNGLPPPLTNNFDLYLVFTFATDGNRRYNSFLVDGRCIPVPYGRLHSVRFRLSMAGGMRQAGSAQMAYQRLVHRRYTGSLLHASVPRLQIFLHEEYR